MSQDPIVTEAEVAKSLRLRGPQPPIAQVSRRALMITGAVLALGVAGALGWSLVKRERSAPPPTSSPAPAPPEKVTALPRGYLGPASVPPLGPPLPGDLGRPILKASRQGKPTDWPQAGSDPAPPRPPRPLPDGGAPDPSIAARQAALTSGLFLATVGQGRGAPEGRGDLAPGDGALGDPRTTSVERLQAPVSPYILQAGAIIPAALVTGLSSDAPGVAIAQVTQDVHDSLGRGVLLIPAGARLVGDYDAQAAHGQSRLRVVWTRLILPSGQSIVLDKLPAADAQGMAGLRDGVDRHGGRVLAAAALSTVLAIGAESGSASDEPDLVRAIRRGGADTVTDVGRQMVGKSLDLAPTLTIRPGATLRVLLTKDLVLEPYLQRTLP
jgi:type IV secretory pathway VirB10-like protein